MQPLRDEDSSSIHHDSKNSSIPSGDTSVWADVSPLLSAACTDLQEGQLINGDNFNLFAAMSALEIMDPKMDSGMVSTFYSIDEAIKSGFAPVPVSSDSTVNVHSIIDIMDHLLACEATWHMGHSLAQTVFSCIYVLRPERTSSQALLHSYCRVIRATCRAVVSVVSDARTNEEEDLFTMTYGLPFSGDEDAKGLLLLNAVEETICRQLRACKATRRRVLEDAELEPLQTNPHLEESFCKALLCRIRFRKHFLHALNCMRRPQGRGLELARKHIAYCISELDSVLESAEFLRLDIVENGQSEIDESTTASGRSPIGFDPTLNKRLSAPTPPRAIKLLSWKKAIDYYVKLLHNLDQICVFSLEPDLDVVLQFVIQFQKSRPDLVARAHLQLLLVQDGKLYGRDTFLTICARSLALDVSKNHGLHTNEYILQLNQLMINLLKILCANTPWQRRKLGKILNDWRVFHVQMGITVGQMLQQDSSRASKNGDKSVVILNHIYGWLDEQINWVAIRFLMLGFDLDLYSSSEYCMVYWYMYIILWKLAERARFRVLIVVNTEERKAKRNKSRDMAREDRISLWVLFLQCQTCLAQGLAVMIAALRNEGMCLKSQGPFNTENEKFIQHFELLQKASLPEYDAYESFSGSTSQARLDYLPKYEYFHDAQKLAKDIKVGYANNPDKLAEVRGLEQVAERNIVAVNLFCQDRSLKVSFEFTHHPYFATAVVRRS
ncbi:PREDICTED: N-alpha-acetyltransferase 35, NatC auxiliary subunit-like isoform X2 [Camelina sativa]|uniref:N-alpha-acetyltransferase 35, NatC auxiliary subunit-like isoform X1 n=1 Tax=Camelina sativa TaxID=90675 RepID=A0ABM0SNJ9_CAMSA|nr:PREDICTED: N-alpha-acetyltransferase 35, NatC auxiliary subunit-like isoform X1 [Camelina sativa]XP_010413847.1 PREDICTED: N-alpha-acetyltransferase 35, NatC auxiliary subunit-like isoform X2 [Camelina sativa]